MINTQQATEGQVAHRAQGLHMHWVEVRDTRGRTRLEARWSSDAPTRIRARHAA